MSAPALSVVVVIHRMARQAEQTLVTLSPGYQRGVSEKEYEVVVVENASEDHLGERRAVAAAPNVRYVVGPNGGTSPAAAVNVGVRQARSNFVCLLIDGARMVTPRVVEYSLWARRIASEPVVVVPGYHLGRQEQHLAVSHDEEEEQRMLATVPWRDDGYRLFELSVPSGANPRGIFHPFMESNCLSFVREAFDAVGGAPEAFDLPGGGSLNLYLYRKLAMRENARLFVLPGEGSFHQFHGGVTTQPDPDREATLSSHRAQLAEVLGRPFEAPKKEPVLLGAVTSWALPNLGASVKHGLRRFDRMRHQGKTAWPDDETPTE